MFNLSSEQERMLQELRESCCCLEIHSDHEFVWGIKFVPLAKNSNDPVDDVHELISDEFNYDELGECIEVAHKRLQQALSGGRSAVSAKFEIC